MAAGLPSLPEDSTPVIRPTYVLSGAEGTPDQFTIDTQYGADDSPQAVVRLKPDLSKLDMSLQRLQLELRLGSIVLERQEILIDMAEAEFRQAFFRDRLSAAQAQTTEVSPEEEETWLDSLANRSPIDNLPKDGTQPGATDATREALAIDLDQFASRAKRHSTNQDLLSETDKQLVYDALYTAAQQVKTHLDDALPADKEPAAALQRSLGRSAIMLAAVISADLASNNPAIAQAATKLRDQILVTLGSEYTVFTGLGRNQKLRHETSSDGSHEFVLGFVEETTFAISDRLVIDLGGQPAMVQLTRDSDAGESVATASALNIPQIAANADTSVSLASSSTNYGLANNLRVEGDDAGQQLWQAYLRFDVAPYVGQVVPGAEIKLHALSSGGSAEHSISAYRDLFGFSAAATWSESALTWNSLTSFTEGFSASLDKWVPDPGMATTADVSEAVQRALLAGDSNLSAALDRLDNPTHTSDIDAFYWAVRDWSTYVTQYGGNSTLAKEMLYRNDVNWDTYLDVNDLEKMFLRHGVPRGDYTLNGSVDGADYSRWQANYGRSIDTSTGGFTSADGNFDGSVDNGDYVAWNNSNGQSSVSPLNPQVTFRIAPASPTTDGYAEYASKDQAALLKPTLNIVHEFVVNSLGDQPDTNPGDGVIDVDPSTQFREVTLRAAIQEANALQSQLSNPATYRITFSPTLSGTIKLNSAQLDLTKNIEIVGPGADQLTIDAQGSSRVLFIPSGVTASITGVTITGGSLASGNHGAGILSYGDLTLERVAVVNNHASPGNTFGGGIYSQGGSLAIIDSTIANNSAKWAGGADVRLGTGKRLEVRGSTFSGNNGEVGGGLRVEAGSGQLVRIENSTFSGNTSGWRGGGVYFSSGSAPVEIINSTITQNVATAGSGGGIFTNTAVTLHNTIVAHGSELGHVLVGRTGIPHARRLVPGVRLVFALRQLVQSDWHCWLEWAVAELIQSPRQRCQPAVAA
jgi:hypothetical protein